MSIPRKLCYAGVCARCNAHLDENSVVKFEYDAMHEPSTYISSCQYCDTDCKPAVDMSCMKPRRESMAKSIARSRAECAKLYNKGEKK